MKVQGGRGIRKRRGLWACFIALALAAAIVPAALASGGPSAKAAASKSPIVTYTIADVNTTGPQYKNIEETERVYSDWINAHGGIAGHKLVAKFCDAQGTATAAAACANTAVAAHAVAVVGSFTFTGNSIVPILQAGHTAYFGNCCAVSADELTSPIDFNMGNQPLYAVGLVARAVHDGCKHINAVIIQGAESFEPLMTNAATALGTKIQSYISLPATPGDYSPEVAEALAGGADCVIMIVSETPYIAWMPAWAASGTKAIMYGPQGNLDAKVVKGYTAQTNGDVIGGMYPNISLPAWANYRAALKKYKADPTQIYDSLGGLGTWAAYSGFTQIVSKMKGAINNTTFLKTANTAKVNLPGMLPPINFAKPWDTIGGPAGYDRIFNESVTFEVVKNGKIVPLTGSKFENVAALAEGT
jgi:ABC-type branched-subunit amino acid transport system substrate-binding protein